MIRDVVKEYNADPTGTKNSRLSIQTAIRDSKNNDIVYIPEGTYLIQEPVPSKFANQKYEYFSFSNSDSYVTVELHEKAVLIVDPPKDYKSSDVFFLFRLPHFEKMYNIRITGGKFVSSIAKDFYCMGIRYEDGQNIEIDHVTFDGFWDAVNVCGPPTERNALISFCKIYNSTRCGISVTGGRFITIDSCLIVETVGNPGSGVRLEPNDEKVEDIIVKDSVAIGNTIGISAVKSLKNGRYLLRGISILDNEVDGKNSGNAGIIFSGVDGGIIKQNYCYNNNNHRVASGIGLPSGLSKNILISNNKCINNTYGIWTNRNQGDPQKNIRITNNKCRHNEIDMKITNPLKLICQHNQYSEYQKPELLIDCTDSDKYIVE